MGVNLLCKNSKSAVAADALAVVEEYEKNKKTVKKVINLIWREIGSRHIFAMVRLAPIALALDINAPSFPQEG